MLAVTALCGSMKLEFMNTSSFIYTSSPQTDTPSTLTHFPTIDDQPIIVSLSQLFAFITEFFSNTQFFSRTPINVQD